MNCEQVFDVLTRGPFPTGGSIDDAVEAHLARCSACRRLAFALQPAVELFEEAVGPDESRELPAYSGDLFSARRERPHSRASLAGTAVRAARRPRANRQPAVVWPWLHLSRVSLVIALGVSLGVALAGLKLVDADREAAPLAADRQPGPLALASALPNWHNSQFLDRLGLVPACRPIDQQTGNWTLEMGAIPELVALSQTTAQRTNQQCCTQCHIAGKEQRRSDAAVAKIVQSCRYCHTH